MSGLPAAIGCPFCGSVMTILSVIPPEDRTVSCTSCGAHGPRLPTPEAAIEAWNERPNLGPGNRSTVSVDHLTHHVKVALFMADPRLKDHLVVLTKLNVDRPFRREDAPGCELKVTYEFDVRAPLDGSRPVGQSAT